MCNWFWCFAVKLCGAKFWCKVVWCNVLVQSRDVMLWCKFVGKCSNSKCHSRPPQVWSDPPGIAKIWQKSHGLTWYLQFACNICFYNQRLPPLNILIFVWVEGLDPFAKTAFLLTTPSRQNHNLQAFPRFKPGHRDSKRTREAPRIQMKGNPKTQRRIKSTHKMCLQIVLNALFTTTERTRCRVKTKPERNNLIGQLLFFLERRQ